MREEKTNINVAERQLANNDLCEMHGSDKPIAVMPDVEDGQTIDQICVRKRSTQLGEVTPSGVFHDPRPGSQFRRGFLMIPGSLLKPLHRDDVHIRILLRKLRSVNIKMSGRLLASRTVTGWSCLME
jgi:hypothetical protein